MTPSMDGSESYFRREWSSRIQELRNPEPQLRIQISGIVVPG
jgi:hypothetical protein